MSGPPGPPRRPEAPEVVAHAEGLGATCGQGWPPPPQAAGPQPGPAGRPRAGGVPPVRPVGWGRTDAGWSWSTDVGTAAELHRRAASRIDPAAGAVARAVRIVEASDRCVVLGSAQRLDAVDPARLAAAGMTVARRRSGGAAVLVGPGEGAWVDLTVPAGDRLWERDIGLAARWVGRCWAEALASAQVRGAEVWEGPLVRSEWSDRVCFAGLGPGEVLVDGRKVVGVSQRRTSAGVLLQCAVLSRWRPADLLDVLSLDPAARRSGERALAGSGLGIGASVGQVVEAFLRALPADGPPTGPR